VARGTQHRKRRAPANARSAAVAAPPRRKQKQKAPQWQEQLFFQRLRVHAKWAYVALAAAFVLTFVLLGVGSGSTGLSNALQNAFNFGSGGGTSISKLKKKTTQHPKDATAWRQLATAYEQKQQTQNAVAALQSYTALRPRDQDALSELASQYTTLSSTYQTEAQAAQAAAQAAAPQTTFLNAPANSAIGRAYNTPGALQDPLATAAQQAASSQAADASAKLTSVETKAEDVYKKLAKLSPTDATIQIQLGQAAQSASDTTTAVAAYKKFLRLAPTDPLAPQVRAVLKQLAPTTTPKSSGG
jgi:cytochrome c-type biogenesis protein CcmH/NrfG